MKKNIYLPIKTKKDRLIVGGCGTFQEEKLVLDKDKAMILFIELWKFLDFSIWEDANIKSPDEKGWYLCKIEENKLPLMYVKSTNKWVDITATPKENVFWANY